MTRISRGTLTNCSAAILPPMCFDSNTDLWKHLSHFDREETFKFVTWNYRIYWLTWKCLSVGVQEGDSFYRNLQHLTVPRSTRQALWKRAGLSWNGYMRRLKNDQWTNFKILRDCKGGQVALIDLFLSRMGPEDPPNRKKDPKVQKISQNPKNENDSENKS